MASCLINIKIKFRYNCLGFVLVPKTRLESDLMVVTYMPFTLYPSPFRRVLYEKAYKLQPHINELVHKLATSKETLELAFEEYNFVY
jgi:hypothetical protein